MKTMILALVACLCLFGCTEEAYSDTAAVYPSSPTYGCVVVNDPAYGERQVCNTYYYYVGGVPYYYDTHFASWITPWGYYRGGRWFNGYYPGYHSYYGHGFYHPRGYYHGGGFRHLDHNYGRGGGGYHGGYHGGGGHHR